MDLSEIEGIYIDDLINVPLAKGEKGDKGEQGDIGIGIMYIEANEDKTITVHYTDETTEVIKIPDALRGDKGDKGDTPVKGVDYWTEEDKAELIKDLTSKKVTDEDGVHGVRITSDGYIQTQDDDGNWVDVANGSITKNEIFQTYSITDIGAKYGNGKVMLTWTEPEDKTITDKNGTDLITAKWTHTKIVMKTGGYPENAKDGTLVLDNTEKNKYQTDGFEVTGLTNNTTYYFRFFVYSDLGAVNDDESMEIESTPSLIIPNPCTNISAKARNGKALITWTDPEDSSNDTEICNWGGTKIVLKQGSYPTNESDGTVIVDSTVRNQYSSNAYTIENLTNDTTYYGQLFPYSTDGVYNTDESNRFEVTPKEVTVYGVQRLISNSSTKFERIEAGEGLVANATHDGTEVQNDFDSLYPWSDIISVDMSADGTINSRYGDADFSLTNPTGYIMTYCPEFWLKRVQEDGYERIYIADNEVEGYEHIEGFYLSRYHASGSSSAVTCKSGLAPLVSITLPNLRTACQKIGDGWGQRDIWTNETIKALYTVEYANYDTQTVLGKGVCGGSSTIVSGGCDALGMKSGCLVDDECHSNMYRGWENITGGNIFEACDGINFTSSQAWLCKDRSKYASDVFASPYEKLGYVCNSSSSWISKLGYDENNPIIQLPIEKSGSSSTYTTDYSWANTGSRVLFVGSDYFNGGTYCGLWCSSWYYDSADSSGYYNFFGGRLLFKPVA